MLNIQIFPNFKVSSQLNAPRNFVQPSLHLRHSLTRYSEPWGGLALGFWGTTSLDFLTFDLNTFDLATFDQFYYYPHWLGDIRSINYHWIDSIVIVIEPKSAPANVDRSTDVVPVLGHKGWRWPTMTGGACCFRVGSLSSSLPRRVCLWNVTNLFLSEKMYCYLTLNGGKFCPSFTT